MSDLPAFLAPVLEDLASLRSSTARRLRALRAVDGLLATLFLAPVAEVPRAKEERERIAARFILLQDDVATSVISRLTPLAARLLPVLHGQLLTHAPIEEVETTAAELSATFLVIQGLALVHPPTKALMMLDLLLLTRHLPVSKTVAPAAQHTASDEDSGSSSEPKAILPHSQPPLAAVLLDVLFAVLVDAPDGVRVFERAGGLEIVRKVLKSKSVVKDVRMKCLEFLLFYLLPEGSESDPTAAASLAALLPSSAALTAIVAGGGRSGIADASPDPAAAVASATSPLLPPAAGLSSSHEERGGGRQTPTSPRLPIAGGQASPTPALQPSAQLHVPADARLPNPTHHRRAESAASGLPSASSGQVRRDATADRYELAPERSSSATSVMAGKPDIDGVRRPRLRGTTAPNPSITTVTASTPRERTTAGGGGERSDLSILISRARATPSRSVSAVAPQSVRRAPARPPASPVGQSSRARSAAAVPTITSPSSATAYSGRVVGAPVLEPPLTPTASSRYRSSASSRSDHLPRSPSSLSAISAVGAVGSKPEATGRARERQVLLEAFLQTPQKATAHAREAASGELARTPSRYRLDDDDGQVERPLSSPAATSAARAGLPPPTPRHAFRPTTLVPGSGRTAKASVIEPRANGPMLPPTLVPSHGRRASSAVLEAGSHGVRRSRTALQARPTRSSTPAEVTLAVADGIGRSRDKLQLSFFDPLPLPKRGVGTPPLLPPRNTSATSSTAASATEHPSPLLPLHPPAPSPTLTVSWTPGSPLSTPTTSPDPGRPSASAPPTPSSFRHLAAVASGSTPSRGRPGPAVLSDVQAFVLSPSTVKAERARGRPELGKENLAGLLQGRNSVVGHGGGVGLGFGL